MDLACGYLYLSLEKAWQGFARSLHNNVVQVRKARHDAMAPCTARAAQHLRILSKSGMCLGSGVVMYQSEVQTFFITPLYLPCWVSTSPLDGKSVNKVRQCAMLLFKWPRRHASAYIRT